MPVVTIVLYRNMQSFGATCTLKFDPHFSVKWDNSNHFAGVLMACTCMLSYENDTFKFSKKNTAKITNNMCITCTIVPGLVELVLVYKPGCP